MPKLQQWICCLLLAVVSATPVLGGTKDGPDTKTPETAKDAANAAGQPAAAAANPNLAPGANVTALLGVLVMKGVLAPAEAKSIESAPPGTEFQMLVEALTRKGVVSAADLSAAAAPTTPAAPAAPATAPTPAPTPAPTATVALASADPDPQAMAAPKAEAPPVVPAVAPVRVFPVDPPKTGGLNGIKVGPLTLAPYGFIKASIIHDSSDPDGDDFPFPGIFLNAGANSTFNTGPTADPEVHVKARSTRFGLNLEWPDMSKNLTLTGKIEGDFEGNFSEVDNRDVSSIRSNEPQLRLAFVRLDYHASENTDIFFVGGQDWTLFASGAMMNIFETTFNGAFWGNIYTRSPQLRGGFVQTLNKENHVNLEAQFGVMMPSTGQILKLGSVGLAGQLGQGEREGADADRPEWEGRTAVSFQLDKARGVAPAQIALAGFYSKRTSIVPNSSYIGTSGCELSDPNYCAAFPNGFQASSNMWGGQIVAQLPTRWFTVVASAYKGADLRFYFGGQINGYYTNVNGLYNVTPPQVTADGGPLGAAGGAVLGCNVNPGVGGCPVGNVEVGPQKPIGGFGGFVQLGLPLSRWFNADPKGHNAGWQLQLTVGKDQVVDKDQFASNGITCGAADGSAACSGGLPLSMGKSAIGTLSYKFNNWCSFGIEQSVYATRLFDKLTLYTIAGKSSNEWQDHRTEFGPIFTF